MTGVKQEKTDQYTNGSYVSLLKARIPDIVQSTVVIRNQHASHSFLWKVLVSNDPDGIAASFAEDKAEATLNPATRARHVITGPFIWVDVQVMSDTAAESPQASAWLLGVG
jgi:hypothetical protein